MFVQLAGPRRECTHSCAINLIYESLLVCTRSVDLFSFLVSDGRGRDCSSRRQIESAAAQLKVSKLIESRQFNTYSLALTHTQRYLALCVVVVAACGTRFIVDKCAFIYRRHHSGSLAVHVWVCIAFLCPFIYTFSFYWTHNRKARFKGKQRERVMGCVWVCVCVHNTSKVKFKLNLTNKSQKLYARAAAHHMLLW